MTALAEVSGVSTGTGDKREREESSRCRARASWGPRWQRQEDREARRRRSQKRQTRGPSERQAMSDKPKSSRQQCVAVVKIAGKWGFRCSNMGVIKRGAKWFCRSHRREAKP